MNLLFYGGSILGIYSVLITQVMVTSSFSVVLLSHQTSTSWVQSTRLCPEGSVLGLTLLKQEIYISPRSQPNRYSRAPEGV